MDLLSQTLEGIQPQNQEMRDKALARLERLTMPHWALGRLMDLALDLAGITGSMNPPLDSRVVVVMAGDHGVVAEGVSLYPQEVTRQMIANIVAGGAGINAVARTADCGVVAVDMGVIGDLEDLEGHELLISRKTAHGTENMAQGPAMSRDRAVECLEAGISVAHELGEAMDLFGTGDMGIGNTTPSSAIIAAISGKPVAEVTGHGTGIDDEAFKAKVSIIERSLEVNRPDPHDGIDLLSKVGGFEIGGIAGLILGAAHQRKPVVIDGLISTAGALIAHALNPTVAQYMIAGHRSVERGHIVALEILGKKPLMDLDMRLGEGTGAALAMNIVEAAKRILTEVATFEEAAVSDAGT